MCPQKLLEAIGDDRRAGRTPLMVVGTAGTTNTGAVDPLETLAEICQENDLWFHIDGAYGAPAALSPVGLVSLAGLERADSLVLDPHKWLFQPYDAGCLLIRPGVLEACFSMNPEYLQDVRATSGEIDLRNRGFELSRRSRALKLWYSLRTYGLSRFREAITHSIELAEFAEEYLRAQPERWTLVTPAQLGILCFALRDQSAEEHRRRAKALSDTGFACVTTSVLKAQTVFRLCIINPLTTQADITETIDRLAACGSESAKR
jgi:glutamate/tyrosine decarboxylase-like PLP-dependent enzyme